MGSDQMLYIDPIDPNGVTIYIEDAIEGWKNIRAQWEPWNSWDSAMYYEEITEPEVAESEALDDFLRSFEQTQG